MIEKRSDRGQGYTLEAIIAGLLIVSALVFALQVTAVTPLSASTSSQHIENQQRATAEGALAAAAQSDALKQSISTFDEDGEYFDSGRDGAYTDYPDDEFGAVLERSFAGRGLAVNIDIRYQDSETSWDRQRFLDRGSPSDNAVTATRTVTLYDSDPVFDEDGNEDGTWDEKDPFDVTEDVNQDSDVYNVVTVEVTVWRM